MATREENLKKINDELEKLDDEELDKVAGGAYFSKNPAEKEPEVNIENQSRKIISM